MHSILQMLTSSGRLSTCPSGPVMPRSSIRCCSYNSERSQAVSGVVCPCTFVSLDVTPGDYECLRLPGLKSLRQHLRMVLLTTRPSSQDPRREGPTSPFRVLPGLQQINHGLPNTRSNAPRWEPSVWASMPHPTQAAASLQQKEQHLCGREQAMGPTEHKRYWCHMLPVRLSAQHPRGSPSGSPAFPPRAELQKAPLS